MSLCRSDSIADEKITEVEKVNVIKKQLSKDAACLMEELLKQGYNTEEVLDLFLRCTNDIEKVNSDGMFKEHFNNINLDKIY